MVIISSPIWFILIHEVIISRHYLKSNWGKWIISWALLCTSLTMKRFPDEFCKVFAAYEYASDGNRLWYRTKPNSQINLGKWFLRAIKEFLDEARPDGDCNSILSTRRRPWSLSLNHSGRKGRVRGMRSASKGGILFRHRGHLPRFSSQVIITWLRCGFNRCRAPPLLRHPLCPRACDESFCEF